MTSDLFIEYIENILSKDNKKKTSYIGSIKMKLAKKIIYKIV